MIIIRPRCLVSSLVNRQYLDVGAEQSKEEVVYLWGERDRSGCCVVYFSRARGAVGSGDSGVGTLSDICLHTAAGTAGWGEHSAGTTTTTITYPTFG